MLIDVQCPHCGKGLEVPDSQIGEQARCSQCQSEFVVQPADEGTGELADQWHVQTGEGHQYGPVSKSELDTWASETRLDSACQVRRKGSTDWRPASELYPGLPGAGVAVESESGRSGPELLPGATTLKPVNTPGTVRSAVETAGNPANPFRSPQSQYFSPDYSSDETGVTMATRQALKDTKPWVTFLAVLGFIGGFFMLLFAGTTLFVGFMGLFAIVYIAMAIAYLAGAYYLLAYGQRIGDFLNNGTARSLERAIVAQKSFWRLLGITFLLFVVIYAVIIVAALAGGVAIFNFGR